MSTGLPIVDPANGLPPLSSHEAIDASRGYVAGWAQAIDAILGSEDNDTVYVEAFEDVAIVAASGEFGGIQIKDKAGKFSITQEEPCGMLDRWATVVQQRPGSWFRFCSTQVPSNLHDHSDSFVKWVGGDHSDQVLNELGQSLAKFVNGKHKGKFKRLEQLVKDPPELKRFWSCIDWRLSGLGFNELIARLLDVVKNEFPGDVDPSSQVRRLHAWIGAVAVSAASEQIDDRRWNKKKLFAIDPKTDVRFAFFANQIDRLVGPQAQKNAAKLDEILELVKLMAERRPDHRPTLKPSDFVQGARLEKAATSVVEVLTKGARLVALSGRPGDGKSEAGRQLAVLVSQSYYVELDPVLGPRDAWRQALLRVAKALGAEPEPDINQQELKGTVRELLAEEGSSLIIFDNVDGDPPFPLQELLLHGASSKCVCIGGGLKDCDVAVALEAPTEQEFIDIASDRLGGMQALSGTAAELIRDIGRLCDWSALCGRAVGWQCSPEHVEEDLRSFRDALQEVGAASLEQRIEAAIRKCWSVLDAMSRRRVRFIAALGLPQVGLIMLPQELRQGAPGSWRLLERSGVAPRDKDKKVEGIRIHRLIASWADKNMEPESVVDVAAALLRWVRDSQLADEFKAFSPLLRAFTNGFQVVARHGFPQGMPPEDIGSLRRAYLDGCGHLALERPALERHIHMGMDGVSVSALPPVVLGQLLDAVPERIAEGSEYLKALRREVAATLSSWVERNPSGDTYLDESQADLVDAYRHYAKELFRTKTEIEAVVQMQRIDRICAQAVERSPRRPMWHVLQTKGRVQLARRVASPDAHWQLELLELLERRQDPLPDYLRLAGLRLVVKAFPKIMLDTIQAGQREVMIREGLELCRRRRSHVIQEEFLLAAVTAIGGAGLLSLYPEVIQAAEQVLMHSPTKGFVPRPAIGYALFRAAAADTSAEALGRIMQGLHLIVPGQQAPDAFQTIRAAGILRDAGRPDLAEPVLRAVHDKEQQAKGRPTFWSTLELAKTLRWRGNCDEAARFLEPFKGDQKFGLGAADELAKSLATTNNMDEAKKLLEENARSYEADNLVAFADQCRHWVAGIPGGVRAPAGLLGDFTRCLMRREAASQEMNEQVERDLEAVARVLSTH